MPIHAIRPVVGTRTSGKVGARMLAILAVVFTALMGSSRAIAEEAPPFTRHLLETQVGGGPIYGSGGFGSLAHLQARFALWHTIGLGIYSGGLIVSEAHNRPIFGVPLVGRLNLSLPFWSSFEPIASIGVGPYFFVSEGETTLGAQAGLGLLFPGRKLGVETVAHVTGHPRDSELGGYISVAVTALYR